MTWLKVSDSWADHPKVQAAGLRGRALWMTAATKCAAVDSDGHVDPRMLRLWSTMAGVSRDPAVRALVESGLWHNTETISDCPRCSELTGDLEPGAYYFHDWSMYQLEKAGKVDSIARSRDKRKKRLSRLPDLRAAIRARDLDRCRYCGVLTHWTADHTSNQSGTYDHCDPFEDNTIGNLVVSCRLCNLQKGQRTPEEAGMALLPVGASSRPGAASEPTASEPGMAGGGCSQDPSSRSGRGGSGLASDGLEQGRRADPDGSEAAHQELR